MPIHSTADEELDIFKDSSSKYCKTTLVEKKSDFITPTARSCSVEDYYKTPVPLVGERKNLFNSSELKQFQTSTTVTCQGTADWSTDEESDFE